MDKSELDYLLYLAAQALDILMVIPHLGMNNAITYPKYLHRKHKTQFELKMPIVERLTDDMRWRVPTEITISVNNKQKYKIRR